MAAACPHVGAFDPLSAEYLSDPFAVMAELPLTDMPVFYSPVLDYYVVTRHSDIEQIFRDPTTYSAATAVSPLVPIIPEAGKILLDGGYKPQPTMISLDSTAHDRLRRPATRAFTVKRVQGMTDTIRATAASLLDAVVGKQRFDLVHALAFPLPATVIFELMGVPPRDYARLKEWCGYRVALAWGRPEPEEQVHIATNIAAYRRYLRGLVDVKHETPTDDFTSDLLAIHDEDPDRLTLDEITSILFSLSFAGHETTTGLIGNTIHRLLEDPDRWAILANDPSMAMAAVDETLRFDPSVPVWRRITTRATTLGGVDLPEGAKLFLWLAAAGRDPEKFEQPDEFDLTRRNSREHLAFGKGVHYCFGANLARLEAKIAIEELLAHFPRLRLIKDQTLTYHPNISFRGPEALWVEPC